MRDRASPPGGELASDTPPFAHILEGQEKHAKKMDFFGQISPSLKFVLMNIWTHERKYLKYLYMTNKHMCTHTSVYVHIYVCIHTYIHAHTCTGHAWSCFIFIWLKYFKILTYTDYFLITKIIHT